MHNPNDVPGHASGELAAHGGIIAGTVVQFAEALGTAPGRVVEALTGIGYVNDTAEEAGKGYGKSDRVTDPARRSLAFTTEQYARLHATIITEDEPTL